MWSVGDTWHLLFCSVQCPSPPHPLCACLCQVSGGPPSREHITARRWHPWEEKRKREPGRAWRCVQADLLCPRGAPISILSLYVHVEHVCPCGAPISIWILCVCMELMCPCRACVRVALACPHRAHHRLMRQPLVPGSRSGYLQQPRENAR